MPNPQLLQQPWAIAQASAVPEGTCDLLDFLPILYPGGDSWLNKVNRELINSEADAFEIRLGGQLLAVAFGKPKPNNRYKLRTIFVSPAWRRHGFGKELMSAAFDAAQAAGANEIYVTAAESVRTEFGKFAISHGFAHVATLIERYGGGRNEDVYSCPLAL